MLHFVIARTEACPNLRRVMSLPHSAVPGEDRVTYGPVKPTDVPRIIADHLVNGNIVEDLVVAKLPNKK